MASRSRIAPLAAACALALSAGVPAAAIVRLPAPLPAVPGNPVDVLAGKAIESTVYEPATHCTPRAPRPGMQKLVTWLSRRGAGVSWGTYRCELWGTGSASLHAEGRALDWHLDATRVRDRGAAAALIRLLLAPDRTHNPQALARRMGVQELIWDCGYWSTGMMSFKPYSACLSDSGRVRARVDPTLAHRDHIHIGMTRAGAMGRTSFWTRTGAAVPGPTPGASPTPAPAPPGPTPTPTPEATPAEGYPVYGEGASPH